MRRSWAYVANGFRLKLAGATPTEKQQVKIAVEEFYNSPPQYLPIVETKDNATSSTIEVCKIIQTAAAYGLVKANTKPPKLLEVATTWLLDNGYEAQNLRAVSTVFSCLSTMEQFGFGDPLNYAQGRLALLRSAHQILLHAGGVDRDTGAFGPLLTGCKVTRNALVAATGLPVTEEGCGSDEEFFELVAKGVFPQGFYLQHIEPFVNATFPSTVATFMIQHRAGLLGGSDGPGAVSAAMSSLPPPSACMAWNAFAPALNEIANAGGLSGGSGLAVLEALVATPTTAFTDEVVQRIASLIEATIKSFATTAASDIGSAREMRRLLHSLAYLHGSSSPYRRYTDVKELHRLIEVVRPKILQLIATPNLYISEISMLAGALSRCQTAIGHGNGGSGLQVIIHIDLIRALVAAVCSAKAPPTTALGPFINAVSMILEKEWRNPKLRRSLATLMISKTTKSGGRTLVPPIARLLILAQQSVDANTSDEISSGIILSALRLQNMLGDLDTHGSLIGIVGPIADRLAGHSDRVPKELRDALGGTDIPQLMGLRSSILKEEHASETSTSPATVVNDLPSILGGFDGSVKAAAHCVRSFAKCLQVDTDDNSLRSHAEMIYAVASEHCESFGVNEVVAVLAIAISFDDASKRTELANRAMERAIVLGKEPGIAGKARLMQGASAAAAFYPHSKATALLATAVPIVVDALLKDTQVASGKALEKLNTMVPQLSVLAMAATKLASTIASGVEDTEAECGSETKLVSAIAGYLEPLYASVLEQDEIPETLVEVSKKGLPPLLAAMQAAKTRHKLHFTLLPDLSTLTDGLEPMALLGVLRSYSQVGVWNNRAMASLCCSIVGRIVIVDGASLRSACQLLMHLERYGLMVDLGREVDASNPIQYMVHALYERLTVGLKDDGIALADRRSSAATVLQSFLRIPYGQDGLRIATDLVRSTINDIQVVETFTALLEVEKFNGGVEGFVEVLYAMHRKGMLSNLRTDSMEFVAICIRHTSNECPTDVIQAWAGELVNGAIRRFADSGSFNHFAGFVYAFGPLHALVPHTDLEGVLAVGLTRFQGLSAMHPAAWSQLAVGLSKAEGEQVDVWRGHLASRAPPRLSGDTCAAWLFLPQEEATFTECCRDLVGRRKSLTPRGAVWVLDALKQCKWESEIVKQAATVAAQLVVSLPFEDALEGTTSKMGSSVVSPDSVLGMVRSAGITTSDIERLSGEALSKVYKRRIYELSSRSGQEFSKISF